MPDDDDDVLQREREMSEHEREARERDPAERDPSGSEDEAAAAKPAPPGALPGTSGQP